MPSIQTQSIINKLASSSMGQMVRQFLEYLMIEAGLSNNTILAYGRDLKAFLEYCETKRIHSIEKIRPLNVQQYMQLLAKEQKSDSSIKRFLVAMRMFLRYSKLNGWIDDDYVVILETPKIWQKLPIVCNKKQVLDLLNAPCPETRFYLRDRAILELMYATGIRANELSRIKISDLNLNIGYLRCFGKGGRERVIPIGKVAIGIVKRYLKELRPQLVGTESGDFLILSRTGRPFSRIEVWRLVKKYAISTGMPRNLTAHTIRHCFATHLLSGGADLRSVQEMLGHVDITTTQIYTHVDHERLCSIHKKYHPRP